MNEGTYSEDLRNKVIQFIHKGGKKREACRTFGIGHDTVYRWLRIFDRQGDVKPKKRKEFYRKIEDQKLQTYVKTHQDATLKEIGEHFGVTSVAIWKAFERMGYTRKKKSQVQRTK